MSALSRLLRRVSATSWFTMVAAPLAAPLDRMVHRLTRGRRLLTPPDIPSLMLTSVGRRSGEARTTPLLYVEDPHGWLVAGTNWGRQRTPDWVLNLETDPRATVEVGGERTEVHAQRLSGESLAEAWPRFDAVWPGFAAYRRRADHREIRVFRLRRS